ncbi:tRNA 2-thiouridine synthesizing protein A [Cohaesibacter sp. ES.047]|uniref:sulfurtransferase TusA family protein n=1 Tax=Cohaesibacter sp. ES.047 TaxID=1798205 RepID=UPI000BB6E590|nr:sulfurtransferase TusA family protein [Cohaesibacter sp. ES.047]SNY90845.1 tRNA 2-thiouridine synthesizing protein A [Cohaesibacter sp. ES.047]
MQELDLSGLKCPLPVLRTQKALTGLETGDQITVVTTDPLATLDLPHFCAEKGHRLLSQETTGEKVHFIIEKG